MGDSVRTIERYYGHLAKGATARGRAKFNERALRSTTSVKGSLESGSS